MQRCLAWELHASQLGQLELHVVQTSYRGLGDCFPQRAPMSAEVISAASTLRAGRSLRDPPAISSYWQNEKS